MVERTPVEWAVLPLKKFFQFRGRAPRAEYWWFYLMTIIVGLITSIVDSMLGLAESFGDNGPLNSATSLALFFPTIAVAVRRLHDTGRSGWWLGAPIIAIAVGTAWALSQAGGFADLGAPLIGAAVLLVIWAITLFVFTVTRGDEGSNEYGPDPYGANNLEEVFA